MTLTATNVSSTNAISKQTTSHPVKPKAAAETSGNPIPTPIAPSVPTGALGVDAVRPVSSTASKALTPHTNDENATVRTASTPKLVHAATATTAYASNKLHAKTAQPRGRLNEGQLDNLASILSTAG
jgi:hypothetical protein